MLMSTRSVAVAVVVAVVVRLMMRRMMSSCGWRWRRQKRRCASYYHASYYLVSHPQRSSDADLLPHIS